MLAGTILHSFGCMAAAGWPQNAQRRFLFFAKGVITDVQRRSFLCWRRRKTVEKMTVMSNDSKLPFTSNFFVKWIFSKKIYFVDSTIWLWKDVILGGGEWFFLPGWVDDLIGIFVKSWECSFIQFYLVVTKYSGLWLDLHLHPQFHILVWLISVLVL